MVEQYYGYMESPIGCLKIICSTDKLLGVEFADYCLECSSNKLVEETICQMKEYFEGQRQSFDLPLGIEGTDFQVNAWNALLKIPYGETVSYKEQALNVGNAKATRAIGGANNKNKIAIVIPCHRVVGKNGSLVGYAGGLDKKIWLIEHEKRVKNEKF